MKKITMILLIGMLCLTGCSEGENLKDANESDSVSNTEEKDTKIKNEISDAIKKLQSKDFYAEGLTTEFSHITYIRKYDSEKDKVIFDDTGIQGVYGQAFITIDYKNKGKNQVVKYYDGTMSGMFKNDVLNPSNMLNAEGYSEEKITFDNVLKKVLDINNIEPKIFELKDQKYLYDNELVEIPLNGNFYEDRENYGQSVDWNFNAVYAFNFFNITNLMNETNSQNLAYFYKWTKPTFRMVPSYYFDVGEVIKNNDGGKK